MPEIEASSEEMGQVMHVSSDILEITKELSDNLTPVLKPQTEGEGVKDAEAESELLERLDGIRRRLYDIRNRLQL